MNKMKFTISTLEEPFAFFEDYIRLGGIRRHLNEYIERWVKSKVANPTSIEVIILDNDCDIIFKSTFISLHEDGSTEDGVLVESSEEESFSEISEHQLRSEVLISKKLIKKSCQTYLVKFNDSSNILSFHIKSLDELIKASTNTLEKFPFCKNALNSLNEYLKSFLLTDKTISTSQNQSIELPPIADYKVALVHEIFDFWKLNINNGKGPIIMEEQEHERLISLIIEMLNQEKSPTIDIKFKELPISKYLITYCFYVLKIKIYGNKRGKDFFKEFLKNAFVDFNDYKEEYFKRKFATRPLIAEKWYPKIILEAMNEE